MRQCLCATLLTVLNSQILSEGMSRGMLCIRLSTAPFTTSFIAHDIMKFKGRKPVIQASFYQYGCTLPSEEPGIMVDAIDNDFGYDNFRTAALRQWNDAIEVKNVEQLRELYTYVNSLK